MCNKCLNRVINRVIRDVGVCFANNVYRQLSMSLFMLLTTIDYREL